MWYCFPLSVSGFPTLGRSYSPSPPSNETPLASLVACALLRPLSPCISRLVLTCLFTRIIFRVHLHARIYSVCQSALEQHKSQQAPTVHRVTRSPPWRLFVSLHQRRSLHLSSPTDAAFTCHCQLTACQKHLARCHRSGHTGFQLLYCQTLQQNHLQ